MSSSFLLLPHLQPRALMPDTSSRIDSFNAKTTSVSYPWPEGVTGVERIALAAQGDLQRVLSAYFDHPIDISLVYSQTSRQTSSCSPSSTLSQPDIIPHPTPFLIASTSPTSPITQTRQVHLKCSTKIVCTATSTVRITSPEVAHLFLQEKYAIGQMFRTLEKVPKFDLVDVGLGDVVQGENAKDKTTTKKNQLWRKYTLSIPHFACEILEVFPDRQMFVDGEGWLSGSSPSSLRTPSRPDPNHSIPLHPGSSPNANPVVWGILLLTISFELWRVFAGKTLCWDALWLLAFALSFIFVINDVAHLR